MLLWAIFAVKMSVFHGSIWASGVAAQAVFRDQVAVCMCVCVCGSGNLVVLIAT